MKKSIKYLVGFSIVWFFIHSLVIIIDGLTDEKVKSDVGVIFGNKVNEDGSLSERLEKRCDKGVKLYKDSLVEIIVVSGGLGKEGHYEGAKMNEYLINKGVPKDRIVIDNSGNTTEAAVHNLKKMNLNVNSVTVITQYYHISRAKLAFRNGGYDKVYGGHADHFELKDIYSLNREFFGYYKYLLLKNNETT